MTSPYCQAEAFDVAAKRAALIAALFPAGLPTDVLPIKVVDVASITTGATTTITCRRPHQLRTGQIVTLAGIGGTVEANGTYTGTVATPSENELAFTIPVNSTNAYTSGGTVTQALDFNRHSIVANWRPYNKFNSAACDWVSGGVDRGIRYSFRYVHPRGGINRDKVLIWCHGHDTGAWASAYTTLSTTTPNSSSQRFQLLGLPATPANANWKVPFQNGIGVLEIATFGSYLNSIAQGFGNSTIAHDQLVADMGAECVGQMIYPMIVAVNAVLAAGKTPIVAGFSGGGWMALLAAAIDTRIKQSFTMSGWNGVIENTALGTIGYAGAGDGEQLTREVYDIANAHEIAIMGVAGGRAADHIWNITGTAGAQAYGPPTGTGADTVMGMTAANLRGLQTGGLVDLAKRYGGTLRLVGYDGLNDPVTTFASGSAANYTDTTLLADVATSAQNAGATPASFAYTGAGHHVMNQAIDHIVSRALSPVS